MPQHSTHSPRHLTTYLLLILTNLIWGGTWVVGKLLVQAQVPPLTASALRFLLSAAVLGALLVWREGRLPRLPRSDWMVVLGMGLTGIFLYSLCFLIGLRYTAAGRGALIIALNSVMIALAAWLFFHDTMSRKKALGIALALVGCLWVVAHGHPMQLLRGDIGWGDLLIVGCVLMWAVYTFVSRRASGGLSPLAMNFYACAVGGGLLLLTTPIESPWTVIPQMSWRPWVYLLFLALGATVAGYTWYLRAVEVLGASRAAMFTNITPISGVVMGAWFIHERLPASVLIGGMVTIFGVLLTLWADNRRDR